MNGWTNWALHGANKVIMEAGKKDESVIYEKEIIVPLDPAHDEKPTLVERELIEKGAGKERRK